MADPHIPMSMYVIASGFTMMGGLAGGLIGFYKSKSDFQMILKDYRTAADCANCYTKSNYTGMEMEVKEHSRKISEVVTELKLVKARTDTIIDKIEELKNDLRKEKETH